MKAILIMCICLLFNGCASFQTGLQLAEFGVKVGFDIHNYVADKKEEAKELVDANQSRQ